MSSIFGVLNTDGTPVRIETLERMNSSLGYRVEAPAQCGIWGHIGLGMRPNRTNPAQDAGPALSLSLTAPVVADSRIDNYDELCRELGLEPGLSSHAEIVALAFQEWGVACVDHLLGDFAIAVYDPAEGRLFCARDHLGVRPVYYSFIDGIFAFATDARAILAIDHAPRKLADNAVLDYLLGHLPNEEDYFLEGIKRLPGGHQLMVDSSGMKRRRYWSLNPDTALGHMDADEAAKRFRALFDDAIRTRLGTDGKIGSFLSGGLDSSAVTASAVYLTRARGDQKPICTFSAVFPDVPEADESAWINDVVNFFNFDNPVLVPYKTGGKGAGPLRDITEITQVLGEPIPGPNLYFTWDLIAQAAETGVDVLLTGHDGDSVVGHAMYKLTNLAVAERWDEVETDLTALLGVLANYKNARLRFVQAYLAPAVGIQVRRLRFISAFRILQHLHREFKLSRKQIMSAEVLPFWFTCARDVLLRRALKPEMLRGSLKMRWRVLRRRLANATRPETRAPFQHVQSIKLGAIGATFEMFDKLGAFHGVELRHPFFDKRLVEFCISIPTQAKSRLGFTRWVLREAMADGLPDTVRLRKDKADLTPSFITRFTYQKYVLEQLFTGCDTVLQEILDEYEIDKRIKTIGSQSAESTCLALYRASCFKSWSNIRK